MRRKSSVTRKSPVRFRKDCFQIRVSNPGADPEWVEVKGYVSKRFGIQKKPDNFLLYGLGNWEVSHLNSGRRLPPYFRTLKEATEFVTKIEDIPGWDEIQVTDNGRNVLLPDGLLKRVREVLA